MTAISSPGDSKSQFVKPIQSITITVTGVVKLQVEWDLKRNGRLLTVSEREIMECDPFIMSHKAASERGPVVYCNIGGDNK